MIEQYCTTNKRAGLGYNDSLNESANDRHCTVHLDRCIRSSGPMFNASFVLKATERVEFNENLDNVKSSKTEYYTAKELEEIHIEKINNGKNKQWHNLKP